ncbi:uncharacterized protein [Dendropsophus ebraccatus]
MGQCLSNVITDILDNIHKAICKDPVTFIFIVFIIIYKLFVWASSSENTGRIALQPKNFKSCINKEPSLHHSETLNFDHVRTSVASSSATKKPSLKEEESATPSYVSKVTTEETLTSKSTELHVKLKERKSIQWVETITPTGDDNGHLTLYEIKVKETHQPSVLGEIQQLFAPPILPKSQESGDMTNTPGLEDQGKPIVFKKLASKLRLHCLRKILENLMMAFPEIVQKSMQMYNESTKISPRQKSINATQGSSRNSNQSQLTPSLRNSLPVLNVRPLSSFNDIRIARTPIGHRRFHKNIYFKGWKRPSKEETNLPIGSLIHLGIKTIQTLSPEVCLHRSPKQINISTRPNDKKVSSPLEPGIQKGAGGTISKLQTTRIKNNMVVIERHESHKVIKPKIMMSPLVTSEDYSTLLKEPKVISYPSKVDGRLPSTRAREVTHSRPDGRTSARLFFSTDPSKTSTFRLPDVFTSFKNLLLKTMEPSDPPRRTRRCRTERKKHCERQIAEK